MSALCTLAPELEPADTAIARQALALWRPGATFEDVAVATDMPAAALEAFLMRALLPHYVEPPKGSYGRRRTP